MVEHMNNNTHKHHNNCNIDMKNNAAHRDFTSHLFACLLLLCGVLPATAAAATAELPAELLFEGASLLKSFEYAQEQAALKQLKEQQQQQQQQQAEAQFSADPVAPVPLPPAAVADAAVPRYQRELERRIDFNNGQVAASAAMLAAVESQAQQQIAAEAVERPIELDEDPNVANVAVMEQTNDDYAVEYPQQRPLGQAASMWLQLQHHHNAAVPLPPQQQQQQQRHTKAAAAAAATYGKLPNNAAQQQHQRQKLHLQQQQRQHHKTAQQLATTAKPATAVAAAPPSPPPFAPTAVLTTASTVNTADAEAQHRCAIEITTKLPGVCQPMAPVGSACISGDYIDVYNFDCMLG